MNQIFKEIEDDLKQDRFINFFKKYKFIIIIFLSLFFLTIVFIVSKILFLKIEQKNIPRNM